MNTINVNEDWLQVLGKGLATLPADWRRQLGLEQGAMLKAKFTGESIILKPLTKTAPYRLYSDEEISGFLKADKLP